MRFKRYPRAEPYELTPRKVATARRAVQKEKDRNSFFPELCKHQTAEESERLRIRFRQRD